VDKKNFSFFFFHFVRVVDFPDVLSLPLQFVFVESINKFVVTLDDASANVLAGDDDDDDDGIADVPGTRGDDEPLFDDAVLLEPIPDDDG